MASGYHTGQGSSSAFQLTMFPIKASHLQVIQDNFLESIQPINMQGLWVYNPIPGLLGEIEVDRIDPCPKGSHSAEEGGLWAPWEHGGSYLPPQYLA